jgi:hypothetical protein
MTSALISAGKVCLIGFLLNHRRETAEYIDQIESPLLGAVRNREWLAIKTLKFSNGFTPTASGFVTLSDLGRS